MERRKVKRRTNMTRAEEKAELIANEIMMGVQASKYHTCVYNKASNDFNHLHLIQAALKGLRLGLEQKPLEWSEKDNIMLENIILCLKEYCLTDEINWLKSLRSSWKPSKWRRYIWAVNLRFDYDGLVRYEDNGSYEIVTAGNKPKRQVNGEYILLKDISSTDWKPSEEQMEALSWLVKYVVPSEKYIILIKNLYDDLKKL